MRWINLRTGSDDGIFVEINFFKLFSRQALRAQVSGFLTARESNLPLLFMLGVHIEGEVREPGYLEGGDYCPASSDLHFVGVGLRSNMEAVQQLMDEDLFGARRVAVVRDDYEQSQVDLWRDSPQPMKR